MKRKSLLLTLGLGVITSVVLQGCSLGIGADDFSCPGLPNGVQCTSSWDLYEMTNNGNVPKSNVDNKQEDNSNANNYLNTEVGKTKDFIIDNYVAPQLPNEAVPVRTPAHVMRVWVAPYEDTEGNFIVSGYIYKEIESRTWTLGINDSSSSLNNRVIEPLKTKE